MTTSAHAAISASLAHTAEGIVPAQEEADDRTASIVAELLDHELGPAAEKGMET